MKIRKLLALAMCVLILLSLAGCAASTDKMAGNGMAGDYPSKEEASLGTDSTTALPENRKLIQTVTMYAETEDMIPILDEVNGRIAELGGYIESSNIHNGSAYGGRRYRTARLTIRIPAKELDAFLSKVEAVSNVVSTQKTVEDVTLNYVSTESRLKALQAEEERLLELMAKANTLNDLLTIEKRLTEVRTELERVASTLRVYDNQVDYATIHLTIEEVKEYTEVTEPETLWERISTGFVESLEDVGIIIEDLFVFFIVSIPYFALLSVGPVTVLLIVLLVMHIVRKKRSRK